MKKTVLSLSILSLLFSCSSDDDSTPAKYTVKEQTITVENISSNNFTRFHEVTSKVPVDINEDGISNTDIFSEEWYMCQRDDYFNFRSDQTIQILDGVDPADYNDCTLENGTEDYILLEGTWEITGTNQITISYDETRTLVLENVILFADEAYLNNDSSEYLQFDIYDENVEEFITYKLKS